ncbi:MAG: type III pantothenate kinase [Acidobacteria bacterium]|nr:type III pantothenate kinase [Acidobacteriota bacterium]
MLLAIDIGNSTTKFGIFESGSLIDKFVIPTVLDYTVDELSFDRLRYTDDRFFQIDAAIVSSVVPEMNGTLAEACKKLLKITPSFVDYTFDFGMNVGYDPPSAAGTDRLVNAAAAAAKYGVPVIACSFGTATTIDVVDSDRKYLGGTISPGLKTLVEALHLKTSKLPLVTIERPKNVIGNTTKGSINSGTYYGHIGMVEGILQRIFEELGQKPKVVATGGFASVVAENSSLIDVVDENLTLEGLLRLAERRSS